MIDIVGIFQRMGQHEARIELAVDVDQPVHMRLGEPQRIVAGIEELDLGAEHAAARSASSLRPALTFSSVAPASFQANWHLAALAIGQADDLDAIALLGVQRDRASGAPDEIAGMGG